jgi:uncharacterized lipoprotein YajG
MRENKENMNKRHAWLLAATFPVLSLTACGTPEETVPSTQTNASPTKNSSENTNEEVFEVNSEKTMKGNDDALEEQVPADRQL